MFDISQQVDWEDGEKAIEDYITALMNEFVQSAEGKQLIEGGGDPHYAAMMMEYGFRHIGVSPAEMSVRDFDDVVFELIPRKVSTEPENARHIIEAVYAFWQFVGRQYELRNAERILATLDAQASRRLEKILAEPANWGMAKSFVMNGIKAGYDMSTQEGIEEFMRVYNASLLANRTANPSPAPVLPLLPAFPEAPPSSPSSRNLFPGSAKERAERRKAKRMENDRKRRR